MSERRDEELLALTRAGLERRATDSAPQARLAAARRAALAGVVPPGGGEDVPPRGGEDARRWSVPPAWIPAAATAATVLGVAVLVTQLPGSGLPPLDDEALAAQHLELLEDIELYAWMVETDVEGAS